MRVLKFWMALALIVCAWPAMAATVTVRLSGLTFSPNDLTINVGDTVRFINDSGFHDVRADDGSYGNTAAGAGWTFDHVYPTAGEFRVYCSVHSSPGANINSNMNARITVRAPTTFAIAQGIAGTWVNPNNLGQGFLFDVDMTSSFMFVAWFTYDTPASNQQKLGVPTQRWLTMQGNFQGNVANLQVFQTSGGVFNQPTTTTTTQVGTATLTFTSCTQGSLNFVLTEPALTGTIPLSKALPAFGSGCQSTENEAQAPR